MTNIISDSFEFLPGTQGGAVKAPLSKSVAHRVMIASVLAGRRIPELPGVLSEDLEATRRVLAHYPFDKACTVDCGESGSTLRFLLPVIAALAAAPVTITGQGRLPQRPIAPLVEMLRRNGAEIEGNALPLVVQGGLRPGNWEIPGAETSQFLSGLLFAQKALGKQWKIDLSSPLRDPQYVRLTEWILAQIDAQPAEALFEGDWSNSAPWLCAGLLGEKPVSVSGLRRDSLQPDACLPELLRAFGGKVEWQEESVIAHPSRLHGVELDISRTPDLFPCLAAMAACAAGTSLFYNGENLRLKESDRLASMGAFLARLGIAVQVGTNEMVIHGGQICGGAVSSQGDHRLVMAASVAAVRSVRAIVMDGVGAVAKSYPDFWKDYQSLKNR